jgi:hypothetical protein
MGSVAQQVSSLSPECWTKVITQEIARDTLKRTKRLFVLQGGHCWTSTEVDVLIVYDAFHKYGRRWYTFGGWAIVLDECECVYRR